MFGDFEEKAKKYKNLNETAIKHEVAVFGSDYLYSFPFYDYMQGKVTDYVVYNRSMEGLTVSEAIEVFPDCVKNLLPDTVLVSFGENEPADDKFFSDYDKLIKKIFSVCPSSRICVLATVGKDEEFDEKVKRIAKANRVNYICSAKEAVSEEGLFKRMSSFFRGGKISFADAFGI